MEDIFKTGKDKERAEYLFEMAKERLDIIIKSIPKSVPYKFLEEYEIAVQLITSLMYFEGYKTLNHISLIRFLSKYGFENYELQIIDNMRKFRHGTIYYGKKEGGNFYINYAKDIKKIINKLFILLNKKLKNDKQ